MFLPMSWTSPFTVARTILPFALELVASCRSSAAPSLHERLQVGHRLLHGARALDDLRQKHLAGAEEIADDLHAVHQRPFDDVERPRVLLPRLFHVLLDEVDDAVHERVRQPRLDRGLAPRQIVLLHLARALDGRRELDQPLGGIRAAG